MVKTTLRTLWHTCTPETHARDCTEQMSLRAQRPDLTKTGQMVVEFHPSLRDLEALEFDEEALLPVHVVAKWPSVVSCR